jgi:hypothetical protein
MTGFTKTLRIAICDETEEVETCTDSEFVRLLTVECPEYMSPLQVMETIKQVVQKWYTETDDGRRRSKSHGGTAYIFDVVEYMEVDSFRELMEAEYIKDLKLELLDDMWLCYNDLAKIPENTDEDLFDLMQIESEEDLKYLQEVDLLVSIANHPRNKQLIIKHKAQLYTFKDLPENAQLAIIYYMSVDGAAWAVADGWPDWRWGEGGPCPVSQRKLRAEAIADCKEFLPRFIKYYGHSIFGLVDIPTVELIATTRLDKDYCVSTEILRLESKEQWEYEAPTWPVILSYFEDETFQDGWHRFFRYRQLGVDKIPCLFYC